jgi:hypothetical protein
VQSKEKSTIDLGKQGVGCLWVGDGDDVDSDDEEVDPRQRAISELGNSLDTNVNRNTHYCDSEYIGRI